MCKSTDDQTIRCQCYKGIISIDSPTAMQVMTLHTFFDEDVERVLMSSTDVREIVLKEGNEWSLLINKHDAIALAKEFGLVVYEKTASL